AGVSVSVFASMAVPLMRSRPPAQKDDCAGQTPTTALKKTRGASAAGCAGGLADQFGRGGLRGDGIVGGDGGAQRAVEADVLQLILRRLLLHLPDPETGGDVLQRDDEAREG